MGVGLNIIIGVTITFIIGGISFYIISIFNGLVKLKNNIKKSWANINVLLKQRFNELPNLINVCKGYMTYEKGTLTELTKARTTFLNASSVNQKAVANTMATNALKTIFAVAEKYPELKANTTFNHLQERISALENEISDRREFYNASVNTYNIRIHSFPDLLIANVIKYKKETLFEVSQAERRSVEVKL